MAASLVPKDGGAPILIDKPILLIGRHQDCDVVLMHNPKVSRRHCCVAQSGNRYFIRDLGSMNGVRVNRKRISEVELQPADEVLVADVSFIFERDDVPKAPDHESRKRAEKKRRRPEQTSEESSRDEPVAVDDDASVDEEFGSGGNSASGRKDRRQGSDSESEADVVRV